MIERALGCSTFGDLQSHSWPCSRAVCFAVHFFAFHEGAGVSLTGLPQFLIYKYTQTSAQYYVHVVYRRVYYLVGMAETNLCKAILVMARYEAETNMGNWCQKR
jgi:hypothetical protein